MIRKLVTILFLAVSDISASVAETTEIVDERADYEGELSQKLDIIIDEAIDGGLLRAPAVRGRIDYLDSRPWTSSVIESDKSADPCDQPYQFDFSEYSDLTEYSNLPDYLRTEADRFSDDGRASMEELRSVKAYLALGLFAEAEIVMRDLPSEYSKTFHQLISLLRDDSATNNDFFDSLARCHLPGKFWHGISLLEDDKELAATLISENIRIYRDIPFRLRVIVAFRAVPTLVSIDQRILARKLLSAFSAAEIEESSRLTFIRALLEIGSGAKELEEILSDELIATHLRNDVISIVLRNASSEEDLPFDINLEEIIEYAIHVDDEESKATAFSRILKELGGSGDYGAIIDLADRVDADIPETRMELQRLLQAKFREDLSSDDLEKQFQVMEMLLIHSEKLTSNQILDQLHLDASRIAELSGYTRLATDLRYRVAQDDESYRLAAKHASRSGQGDLLLILANQHTDDNRINLLAALQALKDDNVAELRRIEPRLLDDPSSVLRLIEQDVLMERRWVSDELYAVAAGTMSPDLQRQMRRVLAAQLVSNDTNTLTLAESDSILDQASNLLDSWREDNK